jgi:hypothetical protein
MALLARERRRLSCGLSVLAALRTAEKMPMWQTMDFFRTLVAEHGGAEEALAATAGAVPSQHFFSADEVARTILYQTSDESAHLTGVELVMNRGHTG